MSDEEPNNHPEENHTAMDSSIRRTVADQGFRKEMWHQVRLAWYLLKSPEVPWYLKLLPVIAVIYVFIPTDLIPDFFPALGQLDDITALIVGAKVFIELSPQDVVNRYLSSIRQVAASEAGMGGGRGEAADSLEDAIIIEGDFQVVDDENENRAVNL